MPWLDFFFFLLYTHDVLGLLRLVATNFLRSILSLISAAFQIFVAPRQGVVNPSA